MAEGISSPTPTELSIVQVEALDGTTFNQDELAQVFESNPDDLPSQRAKQQWDRERAILNGRQVLALSTKPSPRERKLNEKRIAIGSVFGILPPVEWINEHFGTTTNYYRELEAQDVHYVRVFSDWSSKDFVQYVARTGKALGRKPTEDDLWRRSKQKPWECPSPYIIMGRIGDGRKLGRVMELAGYVDPYNWDLDDYVAWGVRFTRANDGTVPSSPLLNFLSPSGLAPSTRSIVNNFGMANYQAQVQQRFTQEETLTRAAVHAKLRQISDEVAVGMLPASLTEARTSDKELLKVVGQFRIASELLSSSEEETLVNLAVTTLDGGFISAIRKKNDAFSAGDIESTALYLDVFDDVWPMDKHLEALRIDFKAEAYCQYISERQEYERRRSRARSLARRQRRQALEKS